MKNAKAKRTRNNVIVHIILAILAAIWVFPIFWVILTSFRAEKGSYVSTFFPKAYTLANYKKLFTDTTILNFPRMFVYKYTDHRSVFLHFVHLLCAQCRLLPLEASF